jgi:transcriptional regulator with XRE-family HTH domain
MSNSSEGQIDQLVKAKWLELGLSQTDLAEVLGAEPGQARNGAGESGHVKVDRLLRVAEALGVSADLLDGDARPISHEKNKGSSPPDSGSLQSLLELRLLRVFRKLQDHHTKLMLIDLIEQIVKRQAARPEDAG